MFNLILVLDEIDSGELDINGKNILIASTGCPKKSGVLVSNSIFGKNIRQQTYCLFWFKSLYNNSSISFVWIGCP